jgi:O-antigen ligase
VTSLSTPPIQRSFRREPDRSRRDEAWENIVLAHVALLIVGTSWGYGGQAPWVRHLLLVWGSVGIALFFMMAGRRSSRGELTRRPLRHLWPLIAFDALVFISAFNPSTQTILHLGEPAFRHITPRWMWLPSSARPDLSLRELWQFNGIVISAYNVLFVIQGRRRLRQLLGIIAANALALAVFGTLQKLSHSEGIWFGRVKSPNEFFFASFIYHNHWGAFTVLNTAACLALLFHALRRENQRDVWHSPALAGAIVTALLAATAPLSGSRSSSVLLAGLVLVAVAHFLLRLARARREHHESVALPFAGVALVVALAAAGTFAISRNVIVARTQATVRQIQEIRGEATLNQRLRLYRDTWEMAAARPVFGWGLETYANVFMIYNSAPDPGPGGWKPFYAEAHNDWLQSLAEVGFVGTALLVLLGLAPLLAVPWRRVGSLVPRYLLAGCAIVLLYAWVEFPFANPSVMIAFWVSLYTAAAYARLELTAQTRDSAPAHE